MSTPPKRQATSIGPLEEASLKTSERQGFILADFTRLHCHGCELLERNTFRDPVVADLVAEHFISVRIVMDQPDHQAYFRRFGVIWTPTLLFLDRGLTAHYQWPGYLQQMDALAVVRIGLARCLMSRSRFVEACRHLEAVTDLPDQTHYPEALFWLGTARYLIRRSEKDLESAWTMLKSRYPDSPWARKIPSQSQ